MELILRTCSSGVLVPFRHRTWKLLHGNSSACFQPLFETLSYILWSASSEFVSSSIPSWQILTAHAQPFRGARDMAFCLKVPLDSLIVWVSSGGSGETARMRRLAWTFAAREVPNNISTKFAWRGSYTITAYSKVHSFLVSKWSFLITKRILAILL